MEYLAMIKQMISQTDDDEALRQIIRAAVRRWGALFPDEQIITVTAPKNDPQCKKWAIEYAFRMIERQAENTKCVWPDEIREIAEKTSENL